MRLFVPILILGSLLASSAASAADFDYPYAPRPPAPPYERPYDLPPPPPRVVYGQPEVRMYREPAFGYNRPFPPPYYVMRHRRPPPFYAYRRPFPPRDDGPY